MAIFLTRQQLYRVFQRELPEGVYPDGAPSGFFSTASVDAKSEVMAQLYTNLATIYRNYYPQDTTDEDVMNDFVKAYFGRLFDSSYDIEMKRSKVIEKARKQPNISKWEIQKIVASYLPEGFYVGIVEYGCRTKVAWELGISKLGKETFLGITHPFDDLGIPADEWCAYLSNLHWRLGGDKLGLNTTLFSGNLAKIQKAQLDAYGYEIRIYEMELTGLQLVNMRSEVRAAEPARASSILIQNKSLAGDGLVVTVDNVDEFDLIDTITRDSTSTTGYKGIKEAT